jgi:DNA-binding transcriptional MocR family regulator
VRGISLEGTDGRALRPWRAADQSARPRARRLVDQSCALLERQIDEGRLRPGERLPTERALSVQLGASRNVVRSALGELHKAGSPAMSGAARWWPPSSPVFAASRD